MKFSSRKPDYSLHIYSIAEEEKVIRIHYIQPDDDPLNFDLTLEEAKAFVKRLNEQILKLE